MGKLEFSCTVIASSVEYDDGVGAVGDSFADFGEMQVEGVGIGVRGRVPFFAQMRVSVPCWPTRASSWNQTSIGLPSALAGRLLASVSAKLF